MFMLSLERGRARLLLSAFIKEGLFGPTDTHPEWIWFWRKEKMRDNRLSGKYELIKLVYVAGVSTAVWLFPSSI